MLQPTPQGGAPVSAIIGLGANLPSEIGDPKETLQNALAVLAEDDIEIQSVSQFYATPCFPAGAGPDYVNAAAILATELSATDLLSRFHNIETIMGRERETRWGQRTLDIDLLAYGDRIYPDMATFLEWRELPVEKQLKVAPEQIILPHPRIQDRAFVLVPLAEIAPHWQHPVLGLTARQMLDDLTIDDIAEIKPL